ncbi:hypothetical protein L202_07164 [Cryptococcus amylolentus CBS 6039]|uniref:Uncharacterized protein n=1 Tax=Cryptococcus amylolentus CBS 6039 TaxID=1295533 RepID=A0A1E3HET6_9TREE|nr:hypothetical protein L202_07164 [Cryptococcus amylolentus CBS 6039]ODN74860.1 hypothetical protein L202_07164 [Cryptococcus amylolentus CBS 6039]
MGDADNKQDEVKLNISQRWNDPNADQALKSECCPQQDDPRHGPPHHQRLHDFTPTSADSSKTLLFTDDTLESSSVLHFFLSVIGDKSLEAALQESATTDYVPLYHYTMMFAKKWDCPQALKLLEGWLLRLALMGQKHPHIKPLDVFILAAKFDDRQTAARVIAEYQTSEDCLEPPHSGRWGFIPSNQELQMNNIPRQAWEEIPPAYAYALQRSFSLWSYCPHCKNTRSDGPERAAFFLECLDE